MSGNAAFTVPKNRQRVSVRLDNGAIVEGDIFLEPAATDLSIHQQLVLFLEEESLFFPIQVAATGRTEFLNKLNTFSIDVRIPSEADPGFFSQGLLHTIPIIVLLTDGTTLSGDLTAEVPQEKARLSDCLNQPGKFLCMQSDGAMCYINRSAVQKVAHAKRP